MKFLIRPVLAVAALVALTSSCGDENKGPTGPTLPPNINISLNNTNNNNTGGGGNGGSGGGTQQPPVSFAEVHMFGETCPSGISPAARSRTVKKGCTAMITCSPFDTSGKEIMNASQLGMRPDKFDAVAGREHVLIKFPDEPFNLDADGASAGIATFQCTVQGKQSSLWDLTVVD